MGRYNKAFAAALVGLVSLWALRHGFEVDPQLELALLALVEGVIVWAVPNQP